MILWVTLYTSGYYLSIVLVHLGCKLILSFPFQQICSYKITETKIKKWILFERINSVATAFIKRKVIPSKLLQSHNKLHSAVLTSAALHVPNIRSVITLLKNYHLEWRLVQYVTTEMQHSANKRFNWKCNRNSEGAQPSVIRNLDGIDILYCIFLMPLFSLFQFLLFQLPYPQWLMLDHFVQGKKGK